jgi:hypothetical protein
MGVLNEQRFCVANSSEDEENLGKLSVSVVGSNFGWRKIRIKDAKDPDSLLQLGHLARRIEEAAKHGSTSSSEITTTSDRVANTAAKSHHIDRRRPRLRWQSFSLRPGKCTRALAAGRPSSLNLATGFVCSRLSVVPELMVGYWGQSESNEQFYFILKGTFFISFFNKPGRRATDYIKKEEITLRLGTTIKHNNNTYRLDWDINTATQLHSNSTQQYQLD